MYTKVIPAEKVNQSLFVLVRSIAGYLGCQVEIRPQVIIHTDCAKLIELIEQTLGLPQQSQVTPAEQPAIVEVKAPEAAAIPAIKSGKTCKFCEKPAVRGKSGTCGDPDCMKKQRKGYQAAWLAKKSGNGHTTAQDGGAPEGSVSAAKPEIPLAPNQAATSEH